MFIHASMDLPTHDSRCREATKNQPTAHKQSKITLSEQWSGNREEHRKDCPPHVEQPRAIKDRKDQHAQPDHEQGSDGQSFR